MLTIIRAFYFLYSILNLMFTSILIFLCKVRKSFLLLLTVRNRVVCFFICKNLTYEKVNHPILLNLKELILLRNKFNFWCVHGL